MNEIQKYTPDVLDTIGRNGELLSLTDLWKAAGSLQGKEPAQWLRQDATQQLIETASGILNVCQNHIIKSKRGKSGGSYAHKNIALAYAKYLDPALHVLVNEVFFQRLEEENNPDLIGQRYINAYKKKGKDNKWIAQRLKSIDTRNSFTSTLAAHGVSGEGFRNCTNAIYEPLWGGTTAVIREKKGLTSKDSIRDNCSRVELAAIDLSEALASDEIENNDIRGNAKCEMASRRASRVIANALLEHKKNYGHVQI